MSNTLAHLEITAQLLSERGIIVTVRENFLVFDEEAANDMLLYASDGTICDGGPAVLVNHLGYGVLDDAGQACFTYEQADRLSTLVYDE
jgi:hypothetical protein